MNDSQGRVIFQTLVDRKNPQNGELEREALIGRLTQEGILDTSFGQGGFLKLPYVGYIDQGGILSLSIPLIQSDDKVLAIIQTILLAPGEPEMLRTFVFRISTEGRLDESYGSRGEVDVNAELVSVGFRAEAGGRNGFATGVVGSDNSLTLFEGSNHIRLTP